MADLHRAGVALDTRGDAEDSNASWELQTELDHIEQELRAELPLHMRAFARAHAMGRTAPAAPLIARLKSTLETALAACQLAELAGRGMALLRLVAPIAIEDDPSVAVARRAEPSWDGLVELAHARDRAARSLFGVGAIELAHALHGTQDSVPEPSANGAIGPPVDGWHASGPPLPVHHVQALWDILAMQLDLRGSVRIDEGFGARPRTFVVEPGREVIVVVPALDSPAARFELLHELGHAAAALALDAGVPRVVDEGAAAYVARLMEPPSWLPFGFPSDLAGPARHRRRAIASALDSIERALPELPRAVGATPPWGLWADPGAQASYVAAEAIADRLHRKLGPHPARGEFACALAEERDRVERRAVIL